MGGAGLDLEDAAATPRPARPRRDQAAAEETDGGGLQDRTPAGGAPIGGTLLHLLVPRVCTLSHRTVSMGLPSLHR